MQRVRACKDCIAESLPLTRAAPYPGPRCATHHRTVKKTRSKHSHGVAIERKYGLTEEEYDALYAFQGGRCAICHRARGAKKRLAVDHNHKTGAIRGLCCSPCNSMLAHVRDNPEVFKRAAEYLEDPPYARFKEGRV